MVCTSGIEFCSYEAQVSLGQENPEHVEFLHGHRVTFFSSSSRNIGTMASLVFTGPSVGTTSFGVRVFPLTSSLHVPPQLHLELA